MEINHNVVGWFEVPVSEMDRAVSFYETVFGFQLSRNQVGPLDMAWFPDAPGSTGANGTLVCYPDFYKPGETGVLIYFTAFSGDLSIELSRVEKAGGTVLMEKKQISDEIGYMGLLLDTEGNRIALHSRK